MTKEFKSLAEKPTKFPGSSQKTSLQPIAEKQESQNIHTKNSIWLIQAVTEFIDWVKRNSQSPITHDQLQDCEASFRKGWIECFNTLKSHNLIKEK